MADLVITRKNGSFNLTVDRSEMLDVSETADGVSISFKGGIQLLKTDPMMPSSAKNLIKNALDSYEGKKLLLDLDDYRTPVKLDLT
jgi:hypothetical protein